MKYSPFSGNLGQTTQRVRLIRLRFNSGRRWIDAEPGVGLNVEIISVSLQTTICLGTCTGTGGFLESTSRFFFGNIFFDAFSFFAASLLRILSNAASAFAAAIFIFRSASSALNWANSHSRFALSTLSRYFSFSFSS